MEQSLFEGKLVYMGPIDHDQDAEVEASWTEDVDYLRMTTIDPVRPQTAGLIRKKYEDAEKSTDEKRNRYYFTIRLRGDGRLLGYTDIQSIDWVHGDALLKIAIGKTEDRRRGYGWDALDLSLRFAFYEMNLFRISALVPEYNLAAREFFEKAGFTLEVTHRQAIRRGGKYWDWLRYGILRKEWEQKSEQSDKALPVEPSVGRLTQISLPRDLFRGNLVRLTVEDPKILAEAESLWGCDSDYRRFQDTNPAYRWSKKKIEGWFEKDSLEERKDSFYFGMRTLSENRLIGGVALDGFQWHNRSAWLGIGIGEREYWGHGYGTDAMYLILRYAFEELNLHRINLNTFEYNPRAVRCYEKVGFQHEGRVREYINRDGRRWDLIYMGILEDEFQYREV